MNLAGISKHVIDSALNREKEVLQEQLDELDCPHELFDKAVLMAVIDKELSGTEK